MTVMHMAQRRQLDREPSSALVLDSGSVGDDDCHSGEDGERDHVSSAAFTRDKRGSIAPSSFSQRVASRATSSLAPCSSLT